MPDNETQITATVTAAPDTAALQAQLADYRSLAGVLLGREVKPDESPGAIAAAVNAQRAEAAQRSLEMRLGIAEGIIKGGYQAPPDLGYVFHVVSSDPQYAEPLKAKDWTATIGLAAKSGLFTKAPPPAAGAPPVPPPIRPPAAAPDGNPPDKFAGVKTRADLAKLTPVEIATLQKTDPSRFAALTR